MTGPVAPEVTVVVVTWNSASVIGPMLDSVGGSTAAPIEVIVVDNDSADDTVAQARAHLAVTSVIENDRNLGLAAANNQGISQARSPFVLISNPDVVLAPGAVEEMVATMRRHPRAAFVIPRLHDPDGTGHVSVGSLPTFVSAFTNDRIGGRANPFWWRTWAHDEERQVPRGFEACYLVRSEALDSIGLQDTRYWLDWEGIDWSARVKDSGWEIWFCPSAHIVHIGGVSIRQARLRSVVGSHWGMYLFFAGRTPRWRHPFLAIAVAARGFVKAALVVAGRRFYEKAQERLRSPSRARD